MLLVRSRPFERHGGVSLRGGAGSRSRGVDPLAGARPPQGSASQVELDQEFANHIEVRDGEIVRAKAFPAWREGLEAVELAE
jgi:hypothetical protein